MEAPVFGGVDGCRSGWVIAGLCGDAFVPLQVAADFAAVVTATADRTLTLVDIPIGLLGPGSGPLQRGADEAARSRLGQRRSSIFTVPVREAVHAASYPEASARNHAATGKKLSVQSWHICGKIAQADLVMRQSPALQARLRESHPELCFALLNGGQPLAHSKKTAAGHAERLTLLAAHAPNAAAVAEAARNTWLRKAVATDDLLDAMVLALAARLAHAAGVPTLPPVPLLDPFGLRMEIVCPT